MHTRSSGFELWIQSIALLVKLDNRLNVCSPCFIVLVQIVLTKRAGYRSRIFIIAEILSYLYEAGEARKTRILYASNLNTRSLDKFLEYLEEIGAITRREEDGGSWYSLTIKGRRLLDMIKIISEYLEPPVEEIGEYLERARRAITERWDDMVLSVYSTRVTGKSKMDYQVEILHGMKNDYAIIVLSRMIVSNRSVCTGLLLLLDTNLKCVIFADSPELREAIGNLMAQNNISPDRYVILE